MPSIQTILHPTDFSDNSRHAFQTACALARDYRARLILLHVMYPSSDPLSEVPTPDPLRPAESQQALGSFPWPQPSDPKLRVEHRLAEGDSAQEILRLAGALPCDLIVMGTHGRTGLSRLLIGSVAEEVLRKAVCPVLAVKAPVREVTAQEQETTALPGEIISVRPLGAELATAETRSLVKTGAVEVVRMIVRAGKNIPEHRTTGQLLVQCLEGRVILTALGKAQTLRAGDFIYLPAGERHEVRGIEESALLLTIVQAKR
jgi:nucleotide-binding universal stress UspA family protein/quercetin dioxygenase-like cupin family protein